MTDEPTGADDAPRTATIRSEVPSPPVVAGALRPDDTDEVETAVEDCRVVARIERETTGSLEATVDDYVVNLGVATEIVQRANRHTTTTRQ